ncbi:MAG: hypothetical protein Q9215_002627 [Flavoplaca cf. flavocitrina]
MRFSLLNVPFTLFTFLILLTRCTSYTPIPNANDELQIRNKLALYAYAIDFKIYDDLEMRAHEGDCEMVFGMGFLSLISQHAVVSILVEKIPAAEVNGTGNGNGGEGVNSTSSFIASYTGQSIEGGNGTGGVITTLSSSHPSPSHKIFIHVRPLYEYDILHVSKPHPPSISPISYITPQAIELTCPSSHKVLRHLHRQLGSREERLENQGQDIRD